MLQINLLNHLEWRQWWKNISYRLGIIPSKIPIGAGMFYFSPKLGGEYMGEGRDHVRALLQDGVIFGRKVRNEFGRNP